MSDSAAARSLSRAAGDGRPAAPVRMVHLGIGNFFRAHQAWYTEHAPDAGDWGYAAFTGRSATVAQQLAPQDGLYTLLTRDPGGDRLEVVASLTEVYPVDDLSSWLRLLADSQVALVTSTITEAGYLRGSGGGLDLADARVVADLATLRGGLDADATIVTAPARFVGGLMARRAAGAGPIALVPCDNIPDNGAMLTRVVTDLAAQVDSTLPEWISSNVSFVTTMVDRITPRPTEEDLASVRAATGVHDPAAVATEPFAEWVLSGDFPSGRPDWGAAGARFVDDIGPFEDRKLWLLNGSHSLMAYAATLRGHQSVAEAIADPQVRGWVEQWWDVAARHLPLPAQEIEAYRDALISRYENPRIRHLLAQIASDGSQKIPIRIVPALAADRAAGALGTGAVRAVAAWIAHLRGHGAPLADPGARDVAALASGDLEVAVPQVLNWLGLDGADDQLCAETSRLLSELLAQP